MGNCVGAGSARTIVVQRERLRGELCVYTVTYNRSLQVGGPICFCFSPLCLIA